MSSANMFFPYRLYKNAFNVYKFKQKIFKTNLNIS